MRRYITKRLLWLIFVLIGTAVLIFTIMYLMPTDAADVVLGDTVSEIEKNEYRALLGLDQPYLIQLGRYLRDTFLHFDFGTSWTYRVPVVQELFNRLPRTITLNIIAIAMSAVIGIPIGIICALNRNSWADNVLMVVAMMGISIPSFWLALMMVLLFSMKLGWLPAFGIDSWKCWIMPAIACALPSINANARQTRSTMLETIRADFITTARAKGVNENKIIIRHMLPNAMIPIINELGSQFASGIAGTVVIESVFSFPGVGAYLMTGISTRDFPVVRSCILILAFFAAIVQLVVDLIYAYVDPRIKAQYANGGKK